MTSFFILCTQQKAAVLLAPTVYFDLKWQEEEMYKYIYIFLYIYEKIECAQVSAAEPLVAVRERGVPFGDGDTVSVTFLHATLTSE